MLRIGIGEASLLRCHITVDMRLAGSSLLLVSWTVMITITFPTITTHLRSLIRRLAYFFPRGAFSVAPSVSRLSYKSDELAQADRHPLLRAAFRVGDVQLLG